MDIETIVSIIFLYILVIAIVIILLKDSDFDFMSRTETRPRKEDFLPPPPPKPNYNKCEYCRSIFYIYDLHCPNCGAPNLNFSSRKHIVIPSVPKDSREKI